MDAYKLIDAVSVAACEQGSAYGLLSVRLGYLPCPPLYSHFT